MYQPYTTDITPRGLMIARNAMRQYLDAADLGTVHQWLCHPDKECEDGCTESVDPARLALYQSDVEA
jgi:hypothetical protein